MDATEASGMRDVRGTRVLVSYPNCRNLSEDTADKYDEGSPNDDITPPMATKQSLLHLISRVSVDARLNCSVTPFQSDYQWFRPSLPHATIISVLHFFNVPIMWLDLP